MSLVWCKITVLWVLVYGLETVYREPKIWTYIKSQCLSIKTPDWSPFTETHWYASFSPYNEFVVWSVYRDPSPCSYTVTGRNRQSVYIQNSVYLVQIIDEIDTWLDRWFVPSGIFFHFRHSNQHHRPLQILQCRRNWPFSPSRRDNPLTMKFTIKVEVNKNGCLLKSEITTHFNSTLNPI